MKRFVSLLLALSMAVSFSVTAATSVFAAGDDPDAEGLVRFSEVNVDCITVTPDKEHYSVDDVVTYTFRVNGKAVKSMGVRVKNLNGVEFVSGKWIKSAFTFEGEDDDIVPIIMTNIKPAAGGSLDSAALAYSSETGEQYIEGDVFTLKLKVLDSDFYMIVFSVSYSGDDNEVNRFEDIALYGEKEPESVPGDFTGDGEVTSDDAIYLLRYTLFPEKFPVSGFADFTGDGEVTSDDAIYLLRHTLFPEKFPLNSNEVKPSEGLEFDLNYKGTAYWVIGIGECTDKDLVVPAEYNGLPVIGIDISAFSGCKSIESVKVPESVTIIYPEAFYGCSNLAEIELPDTLQTIGGYYVGDFYSVFGGTAYANNPDNWENDVLYIGNHLIDVKSDFSGHCDIKEGTVCIADFAFEYCRSVTGVTIPDSVKKIGGGTFQNCSNLVSIIIPDSITNIGDYAFAYCSSLAEINFTGTKAQWDNITKGDDWDYETSSYVIHCTDGDINK